MLVRERMIQTPVSCPPDMSVTEALRVMKEKRIRRLPVLDSHGRLVGIVSDKDLLYASPSPVSSLSVWEMNYLLAKITSAIFNAGGNIVAFSQSKDATQTRWEVTFKVEDVSQDHLLEALKPVVQEILDVREG